MKRKSLNKRQRTEIQRAWEAWPAEANIQAMAAAFDVMPDDIRAVLFPTRAPLSKWGVWRGASGNNAAHYPDAWLLDNGKRAEFPTKAEADAAARALLARDGVRYGGGASFTYVAKEIDPS